MPAAAPRMSAPIATAQPPAPAPAPRARTTVSVARQPAGWPPTVRLSRAASAAPVVALRRPAEAQTSLKVSSPTDPAEQEATAAAGKIAHMEMPESSIAFVRGASGGVYRQVASEAARPARTDSSGTA